MLFHVELVQFGCFKGVHLHRNEHSSVDYCVLLAFVNDRGLIGASWFSQNSRLEYDESEAEKDQEC